MVGSAAIATLTLNPALDIAAETEEVRPTDKLRCWGERHDPGGGGVNVARCITELGGEAIALFACGGPAGALLCELLEAQGVQSRPIPIAGHTRENFTIDEVSTGLQYRFVLVGPSLDVGEQAGCLDALRGLVPPPAYVVLSGGLAPGVAGSFFARVSAYCAEVDARLVIDSSSLQLDSLADRPAFLVKPNRGELERLVGRKLGTEGEMEAAAREVIDRRCAENVVVSCGEDGALLATRDELLRFPSIAVNPVSAVGAGDSMVGAIVLGLQRGKSLSEAVGMGVVAGAAALLTPGTELVRRADFEALLAGRQS